MSNEITPRGFLKETIALRGQIEGAFLSLAERLYKIREERLWEGEYDDFDTFLLELKISKATASKLCTVHETFVVKHKIAVKKLFPIGWSSLYAIAGHADTKEKAEDLVDRAGLLTRQDLEISLRNENGRQDACDHKNSRTVMVCNDCSFRRQIYE